MFHKFLAVLAIFALSASQVSYTNDSRLAPEAKCLWEKYTDNPILDLDFLDDNTLLVQTTRENSPREDKKIDYFIDLETQKPYIGYKCDSYPKHQTKTRNFCLTVLNNTVFVSNKKTNTMNSISGYAPIVNSFITPDEQYIITLSKQIFSIFSLKEKKIVAENSIYCCKGTHIAISPGNKYLAVSSSDNVVRLYTVALTDSIKADSTQNLNQTPLCYNNEALDQIVQPESKEEIVQPTNNISSSEKQEQIKTEKKPSLWQTITNNKWKLFGATTCAIAGCLYKWRNHIKDYFRPKIIVNFDVFIF
jgi:hypothetical protein